MACSKLEARGHLLHKTGLWQWHTGISVFEVWNCSVKSNYLQKSVFVEYILGWLTSPWDWEGVECPKPEVVKWSEKWSEDGWGGLEKPCRVGRVGLGGRVGLEVPEVSEVAKSLIMKSSWLEVWDSWLKCSDSPCMKSAWGPNAPPEYFRARL